MKKVKMFREFLGSCPNWSQFWGFGGNNSRKKRPIKLKFGPQVVLIGIYGIYNSFWNFQIFPTAGRTFSKSAFLVPFWAQFTPWRSPKSKRANTLRKNFIHRAIQISKNPCPIWSKFWTKNTITFCGFWCIFWKKWAQKSKTKRSEVRLASLFRKPLNAI